jgi:L-lactate dehydrogenase
LSFPSVIGRGGLIEVLQPELSDEERVGLQKSVDILKAALDRIRAADPA